MHIGSRSGDHLQRIGRSCREPWHLLYGGEQWRRRRRSSLFTRSRLLRFDADDEVARLHLFRIQGDVFAISDLQQQWASDFGLAVSAELDRAVERLEAPGGEHVAYRLDLGRAC